MDDNTIQDVAQDRSPLLHRARVALKRIACRGVIATALLGPLTALPDEPVGGDEFTGPAGDVAIPASASRASSTPAEAAHLRAMTAYRAGRYAEAIAGLREALAATKPGQTTENQWGDRWRIQNDLGNALGAYGDRFGEIAAWTAIAAEYRTSPAIFNYHAALLRLMNGQHVLGFRGEAKVAQDEAERVLAVLRTHRDWSRLGLNALGIHEQWMGTLLAAQGDHAGAERRYGAAVSAAIRYYDWVRQHLAADNQRQRIALGNRAVAQRLLAGALAAQGRYGEAEILATAALADTREISGPDTAAVAHALGTIGWCRFQQGDLEGAERHYRRALAAAEASGVAPHSIPLASRRAAIGNVLVARGRWQEAIELFERREQGLMSDPEQFKRTGARHVSWAYALARAGRHEEAARQMARSIAVLNRRPVPDRWRIAQHRGIRAIALAGMGRNGDASAEFRRALPDLTQKQRETGGSEDTGFQRAFWERSILEGYLDWLGQASALRRAPGDRDIPDEAFRSADIARGSSVQEAIVATATRARLPDAALATLVRQEQDARRRMAALNTVLARLAGSEGTPRHPDIVAGLTAEAAQLRGAAERLQNDIRERYPAYAELVDPRPPGLADIRALLGRGEAFVSTYVGDTSTLVWTITPDTVPTMRIVPLGRAAIEADVTVLRKAIDFETGIQPFDVSRAARLYDALFAPDAARWGAARVLTVVAHGPLAQIPMALLVTGPGPQPRAGTPEDYRAVPWLARRIAVTQVPSASAFVALRRAAPPAAGRNAFIGFGDPTFSADAPRAAGATRNLRVRAMSGLIAPAAAAPGGTPGPGMAGSVTPSRFGEAFRQLSALPETADELREIARSLGANPGKDVFVNRAATERNVKQADLARQRVIAFATHGLVPGEVSGLDQPALALANPALTGDTENDGLLTMEEVIALRLDADWVVLSACNTASADGRGAEAVSGLGRAFFYAGARSLLVSAWAVETESARALTTAIFRQRAGAQPASRAEALRDAMLSVLDGRAGPGERTGTAQHAHPAYWAPFMLVGDSGIAR